MPSPYAMNSGRPYTPSMSVPTATGVVAPNVMRLIGRFGGDPRAGASAVPAPPVETVTQFLPAATPPMLGFREAPPAALPFATPTAPVVVVPSTRESPPVTRMPEQPLPIADVPGPDPSRRGPLGITVPQYTPAQFTPSSPAAAAAPMWAGLQQAMADARTPSNTQRPGPGQPLQSDYSGGVNPRTSERPYNDPSTGMRLYSSPYMPYPLRGRFAQ